MLAKLPTPIISATVTPPARKGELGAVLVHGAAPAPRHTRGRATYHCTACGQPGHIASNRRCPAREVG